jgi:hypothetical protein
VNCRAGARARRDGTRIFYRAADPHVASVLEEAALLAGYVTGVIHTSGPPPGAGPEEAAARVAVTVREGRTRPAAGRLGPAEA